MEKIIIKCKVCKKHMKISNKKAKYKCPSCSEINKINNLDLKLIKSKLILKDFIKIVSELSNKIKTKLKALKFKKK